MEGEASGQQQRGVPDCAAYLAGECAYGISGRRGEDSCPLLHRKRYSTFMKWGDRGEKGCKKNPCDKIHPTVCQQSLNLECLDRGCQARLHVQRCKRPALPREPGGGRPNQPAGHNRLLTDLWLASPASRAAKGPAPWAPAARAWATRAPEPGLLSGSTSSNSRILAT